MEKRTNKYQLTLRLVAYADGSTAPERQAQMEVDNHDELFGIMDRLKDKNPFGDPLQAEQFALGLKLFSEVMLKNRSNALFEDLLPAFGSFMKKLKSL